MGQSSLGQIQNGWETRVWAALFGERCPDALGDELCCRGRRQTVQQGEHPIRLAKNALLGPPYLACCQAGRQAGGMCCLNRD